MGRGLVAILILALGTVARAAADQTLNLYEWLATAPTIVVGEIIADDQRLIEMRTESVLRGDLAAGSRILLDLKAANRARKEGEPALDLERGWRVLLLLTPSRTRRSDEGAVFDLVRDVRGARVLPLEGADAMIAAAERLAAIQDLADDRLVWGALGDLLFFDDNPILVDTALDLHLKFRRGRSALLARLEPLLASPRPEIRSKAALLVGAILEGSREEGSAPPGSDLVPQVVGLARRDPIVDVRVEATRALGRIPGTIATESLREIAEQDDSQDVRYEAKRLLLERAGPRP